jgi:ABC-2 type transport system permease protein
VFVDYGSGAKQPFNLGHPVTKELQQVLFLFPGSVSGLNSSSLKFTELVSTSENTGTIRYDQILEPSFMGPPRMNPEMPFLERPSNEKYVLAAQIQGKLKTENLQMYDQQAETQDQQAAEAEKKDEPAAGEKKDAAKADVAPGSAGGSPDEKADPKAEAKSPADETKDAKAESKADAKAAPPAPPKEPEINVVVVGDIDCLYGAFFSLRARGDDPDAEFEFNFDNVPFVLNVLDVLAGDERFVDIRTRRPAHRTLSEVNEQTAKAKDEAEKAQREFVKNYEDERAKAQKAFDEKIADIRKREGLNQQQAMIEVLMAQQVGQRELDITLGRLKDARDKSIKKTESELTREVRNVQDRYKLWAVLLPPIPPLIVAFVVFFNRRASEREGVSKARLR